MSESSLTAEERATLAAHIPDCACDYSQWTASLLAETERLRAENTEMLKMTGDALEIEKALVEEMKALEWKHKGDLVRGIIGAAYMEVMENRLARVEALRGSTPASPP